MKPRTIKTVVPKVRIRRRGNAVLETALVMPVIIYLVFGAFTYSQAYFLRSTLQGAAREGARAAIVQSATVNDVNAAVDKMMYAAGYKDPNKYSVTTNPVVITTATTGTQITVTVSMKWMNVDKAFRPLPEALGGLTEKKKDGSDRTLTGVAVMRKE